MGSDPIFSDPIFSLKDAHGNVLQDGDTVTLVKVGTKAKYIRLIEGIGAMQLKSEFVKKA